mmetsp:Transcript_90675/g.256036  ORF Transcript_90675/g.256036 Transcript_90675/m.256036 type:complete len:205 (-) Transcript_90675:546-1160(-)
MGTKSTRFWQASTNSAMALLESCWRKFPLYVALPSPSRAKQSTSAPFCVSPSLVGLLLRTPSSSFNFQKAVSSVTNLAVRYFSTSGLKRLSAVSRCACCLWPTTMHVRREVHSDGHFFSESIAETSTFRAGLIFFSKSSTLDVPKRFTTLGLFPLATTNANGGEVLSLNFCATLRPLSVGSQQWSNPTRMPRRREMSRVESSSN